VTKKNDEGAAPITVLRMPRREVWVDIGPEYEGWKAKLWVNYPRHLQDELKSREEERVRAALSQIVREHNGWGDSDGNPLPASTDPEFWAVLPDELAIALLALLTEEMDRLPNSIRARRAP
jgi:hypothetical protein